MDMHQNDRLTPRGRAELVRRVLLEGQAPQAVARALGVNVKTVSKWGERFRAEGAAGLVDRSSRPHRLRQPTPEATVEQIAALRRQCWTGDQIARQVGVSPATVSRGLRRRGLSWTKDLAPPAPIRRYERANPGELLHLDIKKLARFEKIGHRITGERTGQNRGVGSEFVHVCLDEASRIAFAQVLPDERKESAVAFLHAALAYIMRASASAPAAAMTFEEKLAYARRTTARARLVTQFMFEAEPLLAWESHGPRPGQRSADSRRRTWPGRTQEPPELRAAIRGGQLDARADAPGGQSAQARKPVLPRCSDHGACPAARPGSAVPHRAAALLSVWRPRPDRALDRGDPPRARSRCTTMAAASRSTALPSEHRAAMAHGGAFAGAGSVRAERSATRPGAA